MRDNKLLVKIANQHFIGLSRTDKKGERYWKCKDWGEEQAKLAPKQVNPELKKENDTNNHANSDQSNNS